MSRKEQNRGVELVHVDTQEDPRYILTALYEMQQNKKLTDVVLLAKQDGTKVSVHRNILSARSDYFRTMFLSSMIESVQTEIELNEVSGDDLKNIIKYIYTGNIVLSECNIESIMSTAHHYQLPYLVNVCAKYLERRLDLLNCLGFWAIADLQGCTNLMLKAQTYACDFFMDVRQSNEFLQLGYEQLRQLISKDDLCVDREDTVFESIIEWLQHKYDERKKFIQQLLQLVRVPFLSPTFIADQKQLILNQELLDEVVSWYLTLDSQHASYSRKILDGNLLAVMTCYSNGTIPIFKYDRQSDNWTNWETILDSRHFFGAAIMGDELITVGGKLENATGDNVHTVKSFNIKTLVTKELNPLRTRRENACLVVMDDYLYVIGGRYGDDWINIVERWNSKTGLWGFVQPLNKARPGQTAAVYNGCIYVIGGDSSITQCYNPKKNLWSMSFFMNKKRFYPGAAVLKGYLYAVGGRYNKSVERYDINSNAWTMLSSLKTVHEYHSCVAFNNRLMVVGFGEKDTFLKAEEYDPIANVWTEKSEISTDSKCILVVSKNIF